MSLAPEYIRRLEAWPNAIRHYLYPLPDNDDLACLGAGDHGHWSMQANNTAAAAFAILAVDPATDEARAGMSKDEMLSWALRMMRFSMSAHYAGGGTATDLQSWGHSWISVLCLERLGHAIDALGDLLPEEDRQRIDRVFLSECDWLLDHYEIVAGLVQNNKPESNIWNGCMLHRTARRVPDTPRRDAYLEKGTQFLLNGMSTPSDAESAEIIAGKPLSEWHVGANCYDNMACNHHGYLNVGYMAICLSNIAMMHFSCRANGWDIPDGLYHHAREMWQLVKTCTFPDGRLWRIGGDTRVRYCYCQDYAIPVWLLARDLYGDSDVGELERGWLDILDREASFTEDGTFLSERLAPLEAVSPIYYVRLEGDRAVTLSMGAAWHRLLEHGDTPGEGAETRERIELLSDWYDEYHGSALVRGDRRLSSWTWVAAQPPMGLCAPPSDSSMVEWRGNLCPRILGMGRINDVKGEPKQVDKFDGGFATSGQIVVHSYQHISEGETPQDVARIDVACVALPDDRTVVVLQRAHAIGRTWLREVKGLYLQMPNDIFNRKRRTYEHSSGRMELEGCPGSGETHAIPGERLTIDGSLSIVKVYGPDLSIVRPAERQVAIKQYPQRPHSELAGGSLYVDEICMGSTTDVHARDAYSELLDLGAVIMTDTSAAAAENYLRQTRPVKLAANIPDFRGVEVVGSDGRKYAITANFGETPRSIAVPRDGLVLAGGEEGDSSIDLGPGEIAVVVSGD